MAFAVCCDICRDVLTDMDGKQDIYSYLIRHYTVKSLVHNGYGSGDKDKVIHICPKCHDKLLGSIKHKLD